MQTTSFLLDDDILIDAGTGTGRLSLEAMRNIDHIFLTHSHLDHVAFIPLLVDSVGYLRQKPITVHAIPETIAALKQHLFNWVIWPDFSVIPNTESPYLVFEEISVGETVRLGDRKITALPAVHTVPAVGYHLESGKGSLVFSGDTTTNDAFWERVNEIDDLRYLIIETAFSNGEREIAILSKHLCPSLLGEELAKLEKDVPVYITHLKPGELSLIMAEIGEGISGVRTEMLVNEQIFEI